MKQIFKQYALYNVWANQKIIDTILALRDETWKETIKSSFSSLQLTLLHMWNTESIWWQRLKLVETLRQQEMQTIQYRKLQQGFWLNQCNGTVGWRRARKHLWSMNLIYRNSKKQQFKQPVYQVLLHLFNHSTYHRGQLITMLRQLDGTTIQGKMNFLDIS